MTEVHSSGNLLAQLSDDARSHTPARLFDGGGLGSYSTASSLTLRADHAMARDAVRSELVGSAMAGPDALVLQSRALDRQEYLRDPELGRRLLEQSRQLLERRPRGGYDLQIIVGDGLSAAAVRRQAPIVIDGLRQEARHRHWQLAPIVVVQQCRVGILNDIGQATAVPLLVLLIGERPGLATAESMSAYCAWKPTAESTDADRNLISNIHGKGVPAAQAAGRIAALAGVIRARERSGFTVKEDPRPSHISTG